MFFSRLALASTVLTASLQTHAQNMTLIDPTWWPQVVRYSLFSASAKNIPCPSPPLGSIAWDYINVTFTDSQANIYVAHDQKEILVAFPGTQSLLDRYLDINASLVPYVGPGIPASECPECRVHAGFLFGYDAMAKPINDSVTRAKEQYPDYDILTMGQSLGGSYALLSWLSLKSNGLNPKATHTFGQPRLGNGAFANYTDLMTGTRQNGTQDIGVYYRHTHSWDAAPDLPPQGLGYVHSGTEFWELDTPYHEPGTIANIQGQAANLTYRCYGQEPPNCADSQNKTNFQGFGYNNAAHDHYAGINYNNNVTFSYCGLAVPLPGAPTGGFANLTVSPPPRPRSLDANEAGAAIVRDVARKFKRWFGQSTV